MAIKPQIVNLNANSVDILNAVRGGASNDYQNRVPRALSSTDSLKEIGTVIMGDVSIRNEFLSALVNRIGRVLITSKAYSNPWAVFKKGMLELGETVENIFVNIAKPFQYNAEEAATNIFKREIPDVRAAFHIMNFQKFYKDTIQNITLRQAFLTWDGITDLISKIVESMYTSASYDEFLTMKYMLARNILDGKMYAQEIVQNPEENTHSVAANFKTTSNLLEFLSSDYNQAGVTTQSQKDSQYLIISANFDAIMDVNVLATSFNMDKAEFMGHRILVNNFGFTTAESLRLSLLFADDPSYTPISPADSLLLNSVPAVIVERDWFMVFDNFQEYNEKYVEEGLYWNYWLHTWKTFSVSPFANSVVFVPTTPSVVSVTVSPSSATIGVGQSIVLQASVVTTGFASKTVIWTIAGNVSPATVISDRGVLSIALDETATSIIASATSIFDNTKTASATLTIA